MEFILGGIMAVKLEARFFTAYSCCSPHMAGTLGGSQRELLAHTPLLNCLALDHQILLLSTGFHSSQYNPH